MIIVINNSNNANDNDDSNLEEKIDNNCDYNYISKQ